MKKGFTLAEVMIVFVVLGILSAILLPTMFQTTPKQEKLRAKKAYNTLTRALETLTNSGPYDVTDGNLDATAFIHGTAATDKSARAQYFCNNLAEVLNIKSVDCTVNVLGASITADVDCAEGSAFSTDDNSAKAICIDTKTSNSTDIPDYSTLQTNLDSACSAFYTANESSSVSKIYNIQTPDNVYWAIQLTNFSHDGTITAQGITAPSFYNLICIDTARHTDSDYIFGMGVRKDGKIIVGTKLQELLDEEE